METFAPDKLQSNRPSGDIVPSWFREIDGLIINQAVISRVNIAVEKLSRRRRRKKRDASTKQSNSFGVSRKRFKPSTPGSNHLSLVITLAASRFDSQDISRRCSARWILRSADFGGV